MRYTLLLLLSSCSMLNPFSGPSLPKLPKTPMPGGATGTTLQATGVTLEQLSNFAWLSVILVLFFPKMREPLVNLWTQLLSMLTLPFIFIQDWAERYRARRKAR